jgi:phosphoserine phosphatase RsbU/P
VKLLIAEDEYTTRITVQVVLEQWGYQVESVENGAQAWKILKKHDGPDIAILDWEMPEIDGLEVCRRIKELDRQNPIYVILLTGRDAKNDILQGFAAGADDYMTKPFDDNELRARVRVAERLVRVQAELARSNEELRMVLNHLDILDGNVPVCVTCHKIQNYDDSWVKLSRYIEEREDSRFSFAICPACRK